jgi:hypothetical protein
MSKQDIQSKRRIKKTPMIEEESRTTQANLGILCDREYNLYDRK